MSNGCYGEKFSQVIQLVVGSDWDPNCFTIKSVHLTNRTISLIYLSNAKLLNTWVRIKLSDQWGSHLCGKLICLRQLPLCVLTHMKILLLFFLNPVPWLRSQNTMAHWKLSQIFSVLWIILWAFAVNFVCLLFLQSWWVCTICMPPALNPSSELQILQWRNSIFVVTSLSLAGFCTW